MVFSPSLVTAARRISVRAGFANYVGCGAGPDVDFDLWRQFTIEHLIGESQGGYPPRIRAAVNVKFAHLPESAREEMAAQIHEANIVTACQFCNSTTSRDRAAFSMEDAISDLPRDREAALLELANRLQQILDAKRATVRWKLRSVLSGLQGGNRTRTP